MKARIEITDPKIPADSMAGQHVRHLMTRLAESFTSAPQVAVFVVFGPGGEVHGATKFDPSAPDIAVIPVREFGDQLFQAAASAVDKALGEMLNPDVSGGAS